MTAWQSAVSQGLTYCRVRHHRLDYGIFTGYSSLGLACIFLTLVILVIIAIIANAVREKTLPRKRIEHSFGRTQKMIYYRSGQVRDETWYINDELHRGRDRPAKITCYESGQVEEEWWVNGRKIRERDSQPPQ